MKAKDFTLSFLIGMFVGGVTVMLITQLNYDVLFNCITIAEQGYTQVVSTASGDFVAKKDGKDVKGFLKDGVVYITSK